MKIGIVTEISYRLCNYGNVLQAYALNRYLRDTYKCDVYTIESVNRNNRITSPLYIAKLIKRKVLSILKKKTVSKFSDEKIRRFKLFYDNNIPVYVIRNVSDLENSKFDYMVVGADVVWHQEHYFIDALKFLDVNKYSDSINFSYAASFGNEWIPDENKKAIVECLNKFAGVSVREASSIGLLNNIGVKDVVNVLDPVFLINVNDWKVVAKKPDEIECEKEGYVLAYLLSPAPYEIKVLEEIVRNTKLKCIIISYYKDDFVNYSIPFKCDIYNECSPEEWVWLMENANTVVTDSFHALAFSTIFERQFFVMNRQKMMRRLEMFLENIKCEERLVRSADFNYKEFRKIDYKKITPILSEQKKKSIQYIENII